MKPNIRWQLLLALLGFALVISLLSFQVQTAGLCTVRVPASGGIFAEGLVGAPHYLNPLLSENNPIDREIVSLVFDGLTRYEDGQLMPALAENWSISEDGRTVRFTLRDDIFWHDGQPVTTADVAFTYGLMQEEAFPGNPALIPLWQSVTIRPISATVIEFELQEPYAPFMEATSRGILPAHRLQGVTAVTLPDAIFNLEPIGTGPFMVEPGQDWQRSRELILTPNPQTWPQGTQLANLAFRFYADEPALLTAYEEGEVQAITSVSPAMLPEAAQFADLRLFSNTAPRTSALLFNVSSSGSEAAQNVGVRKALALALNKDSLLDDALNGQGVLHAGPYLPTSWAYNPDLITVYPFQPDQAQAGLDDAGWSLAAEGTRFSGVTPLTLRFLVLDTLTNRAIAEDIKRQWASIGIATELQFFHDWDAYRQALAVRAFDVALVDLIPPHDPDLYDFWSQEAVVNGQNYAGWNKRRASEALEAGRKMWLVSERLPSYDTFQRLYNEDLPELTLYQHVNSYGITDAVEEVEIGRILNPRDRFATFADWFMLYREVTVACTEAEVNSGGD